MKLNNQHNLDLTNLNTSDVAYLLLIFIIILSLICTDRVYNLKLPHSQSDMPPQKSAVRLVIEQDNGETFYYLDGQQFNIDDLQTQLMQSPSETEFIIVADSLCRAEEVKNVLRALKNAGLSRIGFMTE